MSGGISVMRRGMLVALGALLVVTFVFSSEASAAIFEVHASAPLAGAGPGSRVTTSSPPGRVPDRLSGGSMTSRPLDGRHTAGSLLGFSFTAPVGTTIVGYERHADGDCTMVAGAPPPWDWAYGEFGTFVGLSDIRALGVCQNCGVFTAGLLRRNFSPRLSRLFSALCCGSQTAGPCQSNGSHFVLRWIALRLEDLKAPRVLSSSGSLLAKAPLRGERFLSLKLRDVGGGLLRTRVELDGQRFAEQSVDDNGGRCKPPFVSPVPCKLAADAEVPIDTTRWGWLTELIARCASSMRPASIQRFTVHFRSLVDNVPDPRV